MIITVILFEKKNEEYVLKMLDSLFIVMKLFYKILFIINNMNHKIEYLINA